MPRVLCNSPQVSGVREWALGRRVAALARFLADHLHRCGVRICVHAHCPLFVCLLHWKQGCAGLRSRWGPRGACMTHLNRTCVCCWLCQKGFNAAALDVLARAHTQMHARRVRACIAAIPCIMAPYSLFPSSRSTTVTHQPDNSTRREVGGGKPPTTTGPPGRSGITPQPDPGNAVLAGVLEALWGLPHAQVRCALDATRLLMFCLVCVAMSGREGCWPCCCWLLALWRVEEACCMCGWRS